MNLPYTEVKFYPEVKSRTGLSSRRVSRKRALFSILLKSSENLWFHGEYKLLNSLKFASYKKNNLETILPSPHLPAQS